MNSIAFFTLGCKVNTYETNALMNLFEKEGFLILKEDDIADIYVINTCSVTNTASAKSRKMISRAKRLNKEAIICVIGCYSQAEGENLDSDIDIILGNGNKKELLPLVKEKLKSREEKTFRLLDIRNTYEYENLLATTFDHTRAFVKIEDGCDNFCTYCIIPYLRGPVRCKPHVDVLAELREIASKGYLEVVLAGIHTGRYKSNDNYSLADLLEDIIEKIPEIKRIRLSSIEINEIDDKILNLLKSSKVIASHLHLPLQSGSDEILKLMNRHYDSKFYLEKINQIRSIRPNISITTDIIVGFPCETTEHFKETLDFVEKIGFADIHVFPYSSREGTKASHMPQISSSIKKERTKILIEIAKKLKKNYNNYFINEIVEVIIEKNTNNNYLIGHTSNYLSVLIEGKENLVGTLQKVQISDIMTDYLIGKIVN